MRLATLTRLGAAVDAQVVLISATATSVGGARDQVGGVRLIEKPLSLEKTVLVVRQRAAAANLEAENLALRARVDRHQTMVGESYVMRQLLSRSPWPLPPTGASSSTEKMDRQRAHARTLHALSRRRAGRSSRSTAAPSRGLIESERSATGRGAFTGALADRRGKFEAADGGTIFLDEIGDMSLRRRPSAARPEEQTLEPVGGNTSVRVDTRVLRRPTRSCLSRSAPAGFVRISFFD